MRTFDFSLARDVTVEFQDWRNRDQGNSPGGLVYPVEIVDITSVVVPPVDAHWHGERVLLVFESSQQGTDWCVELWSQDGSHHLGFATLDQLSWKESLTQSVQRTTGLTTDEYRAVILGCVPDRLKRTFTDLGYLPRP